MRDTQSGILKKAARFFCSPLANASALQVFFVSRDFLRSAVSPHQVLPTQHHLRLGQFVEAYRREVAAVIPDRNHESGLVSSSAQAQEGLIDSILEMNI